MSIQHFKENIQKYGKTPLAGFFILGSNGENKRLAEDEELHHKLFRLNQSVSGSFGVAGVEYAMEVAGYYGGVPRRPLLPLRENDKKLIKEAITEAGLG